MSMARVERFLATYTTPAAIESHAYRVELVEEGTYRCIKRIHIDKTSEHVFLLKTMTKDSIPRQIENEVAAIKYVRARTSRILTPKVIAYSTRLDNEWIALEDFPGMRLSDVWSTYSRDIKWQFLQTVVDLYKLFAAITSLDAFGATQIGGLNLDMSLGETVEPAKSHGRQLIGGYKKGPYANVQEYLTSYIDKEMQYYLTSPDVDMQVFDYDDAESSDDDDDDDDSTSPSSYGGSSSLCKSPTIIEAGYETLEAELDSLSSYVHVPTAEEELQRCKNRSDFVLYLEDVKRFVERQVDKNEAACLTHNALHAQNIIVNEERDIVALYNWDFAGFYPLSMTFEAPRMDEEGQEDADGMDWCEAFVELFGQVKEVHPLVASVLEPMDPLLANAWED